MIKKNSLRNLLLSLALIAILWFLWELVTFNLFDKDMPVLLKQEQMISKKEEVMIYYMPGNATVRDYIQVRKSTKNDEIILGSFEGYQQLVNNKITTDSIHMVLRDTISYKIRQDTIVISLNRL